MEKANFKLSESKVVRLEQQDQGFMLEDNFALYPRAMFHVTPECPPGYKEMIQQCIHYGWLKPVSYVYSHEHTFNLLKE